MNMTDEEVYINYFENLAKADPDLKHLVNGQSFFCVENPFDFDEIDEAVRNKLSMPCMLLDLPDGSLSENQSKNRTDKIEGSFMILLKGNTTMERRKGRKEAKRIGKAIISKMKLDSAASRAKPVWWSLDLENINYQGVGPIAESAFGMMFVFRIDCPF